MTTISQLAAEIVDVYDVNDGPQWCGILEILGLPADTDADTALTDEQAARVRTVWAEARAEFRFLEEGE